VIGGFNVMVDANTVLPAGAMIGDSVKAKGTILADGSLLASEIKLVEDDDDDGEDDGHPGSGNIKFSGIVESISGDLWVVSGQQVVVTASTKIKGSPQVGDYVWVEAWSTNGTITARQIKLRNDNSPNVGESRFNGIVESINGDVWVISGVTVMVNAETRLKGSPQVGDYVQVKAFVNGQTLTAHEIKLLNDQTPDSGDRNEELNPGGSTGGGNGNGNGGGNGTGNGNGGGNNGRGNGNGRGGGKH
jgi:hypothetical protein